MELSNTNRIIGDFFEINSDIVYNEHNSKLPKFIARIISRYYRSKLLKKVDMISGDSIILETENVSEILAYIFSSFPPKGKYGCLESVFLNSVNQIYNATFYIEPNDKYIKSIVGSITIDPLDPGMDIKVVSKNMKDESDSFGIMIDKLSHTNPKMSKQFDYINDALIETMKEYIKDNISKFNHKEKKYGF